MQVFRQEGERVILQIEFQFLRTELLNQSFYFTRELLSHVIDCVRTLGLIPFHKIAKPFLQNFNWMDCHDDLPAFESADYLYLRKWKSRFFELDEQAFGEGKSCDIDEAVIVWKGASAAIIDANAESEPKGASVEPYSAFTDEELHHWLVWVDEHGTSFLHAVSEAAFVSDLKDYHLLRPVLLKLKEMYPRTAN